MCFEISTHNGTITARSIKSGEHRTFKVSTQSDDCEFMPGKRLVSLLVGQDNESDYRSFGVIGDDGRIHLWKKHRTDKFYLWAQAALMAPEAFTHQVEWSFEGRCRKCNRLLTTPESVAAGIGPVCAENEMAFA